eukprot:CAMPEP_0174917808 /NCGR_PEP_ID=MMETSP1355-20121228/2696_1 /TAXON_ID=464990 /ORGANISM="Hemiselmis tepida, Strain CCMP443" /LENGTH=226 /DNA_ID=CAMNT_0016162937 /DNA_START=179 /DNA_END=856 /DNA_ORIENTATION=+
MRRRTTGTLCLPKALFGERSSKNPVEGQCRDIILLLLVCFTLSAFEFIRSGFAAVAPAILLLSASRTLGGWGSLGIEAACPDEAIDDDQGKEEKEEKEEGDEVEEGRRARGSQAGRSVLQDMVLRRNTTKLLRLPVHRDVFLAPAFLYAVRRRWTDEATLVLMWLLVGPHDAVGCMAALAAPLLILVTASHALSRRTAGASGGTGPASAGEGGRRGGTGKDAAGNA